MGAATSSQHRFIGRQAILDRNSCLYGYELLFRSGLVNEFSGDIDDATHQTIDSCLSMVACSSGKTLFVNCTHTALVNRSVRLLPSRTVVLEILEHVTVDAELVKACKELKDAGFRIALDDFSPQNNHGQLIEFADYVKIDFQASDEGERREIYKMFRPQKTVFLAEKVQTLAEVEVARAEGNQLFQGYIHARPEIIAEPQMSATRTVYLQILAALADAPMDAPKIERLLLTEPSLCYRLLRLVNSAATGLPYRVSTIQAALNLVGEDAFRKLVTVALASKLSYPASDRDAEQALERAYFCESLAPLLGERAAELYMLGMLSMMDRMLTIPMKQLVELIPIDGRIQKALLGAPEGLGRALTLCQYEERGGDSQGLPHPDEAVADSCTYYWQALIAAGKTLQAMHG